MKWTLCPVGSLLLAIAPMIAQGADLPVSYLVNLNALRASAPAGTPLTFALYIDDACTTEVDVEQASSIDRKSTRLNSSHDQISYAVFCLKKKKQHQRITTEYQ